jgi:hypothetical protein
MAQIVKILRNVSGATRNILNIEVADTASYVVPYNQWVKLTEHQPTLDDIIAGLVIVNNGTTDLSVPNAFKLIKRFDVQDAEETPFDPTGTGLTSTNVQDAIVEAASGPNVEVPSLREVTYILLGGSVPMSVESNLLFEPDPINDVILFLREEVL